MNLHAVRAIYLFELNRARRTLFQSLATPVLSTALYVIVFGAAIGGRMSAIDGISYGAYIVPGLVLLTILSESVANGSFGIYMPRFTGTIYEVLSAPISTIEVLLGYVGAAATKSAILGAVILITARVFVPYEIQHPVFMLAFLVLIAVAFSLLGFIIGVLANNFEQLQVVPLMVVTPLAFLGGTFYSIRMLPAFWQNVVAFNPVFYLINGFRWSFYGVSDLPVGISLLGTAAFTVLCTAIVAWIFKTGYRLRT